MKKFIHKCVLSATSLLLAAGSTATQQDVTYNVRVLLDDKPNGCYQFESSQNPAGRKLRYEPAQITPGA